MVDYKSLEIGKVYEHLVIYNSCASKLGNQYRKSKLIKKFYKDHPKLLPGIRKVVDTFNVSGCAVISKPFPGNQYTYIHDSHYIIIKPTKLVKILYG
jgi:hypothetical protein